MCFEGACQNDENVEKQIDFLNTIIETNKTSFNNSFFSVLYAFLITLLTCTAGYLIKKGIDNKKEFEGQITKLENTNESGSEVIDQMKNRIVKNDLYGKINTTLSFVNEHLAMLFSCEGTLLEKSEFCKEVKQSTQDYYKLLQTLEEEGKISIVLQDNELKKILILKTNNIKDNIDNSQYRDTFDDSIVHLEDCIRILE